MKIPLILFKDFDRSLPKDFITELEYKTPDAVIALVKDDSLDFNRWDFSLRTSKAVLDVINDYNKTHDNILDDYLKIISIDPDATGFLQFNSESKEEIWNKL